MSDLQKLVVEIIAYLETGAVSQEFAQTVAVISGGVVQEEAEKAAELIGLDIQSMSIAREWVSQSGDRFYGMADVTADKIKEILQGASSIQEIEAGIDDLYEQFDRRAMTISRTEVNAAANFAAFTVYGYAGFPNKSWIAIMDEKTRDSHASTHGQVRAMDEHFDVLGTPMMFPGDPSAPAREVVNCRCTILPEQSARSMWLPAQRDLLWLAFLKRTSAWEDRMLSAVRGQFNKQHQHIKSLIGH